MIKKAFFISMLFLMSITLMSCEPNPHIDEIIVNLPYLPWIEDGMTYTLSLDEHKGTDYEIYYYVHASSGGMFVEEVVYYQSYEGYNFTYEIKKDDDVIIEHKLDETAPLVEYEFPKQGSNAPKAAIHPEESLFINITSAATYTIRITFHAYFNDTWVEPTITFTLIFSETT